MHVYSFLTTVFTTQKQNTLLYRRYIRWFTLSSSACRSHVTRSGITPSIVYHQPFCSLYMVKFVAVPIGGITTSVVLNIRTNSASRVASQALKFWVALNPKTKKFSLNKTTQQ